MKIKRTTLLTDRQVKLIVYMAKDVNREQMPDLIYRSLGTVDKEIQAIYQVLDVSTWAGAVNACWELGIFTRE